MKFSDYQKKDTFEEYLGAKDYEGSSDLKNISKSPMHYIFNKEREEDKEEQRSSLLKGSLVHCMILEPEEVTNRYFHLEKSMLPFPDKDFRTAANRDHRDLLIEEAKLNGIEVISDAMWEEAKEMTDIVKKNERALELLKNTYTELSFYCDFVFENVPVKLKCRPDAISPENYMVSLKTTRDIWNFEMESWKYGYHTSEFFYNFVLNKVLYDKYKLTNHYMIVVSNPKNEPAMCQVFDLYRDPSFFETGKTYMTIAMYKLIDFYRNREKYIDKGFEIYNPLYEDGTLPLQIPPWKYSQVEMDENELNRLRELITS